MPDGVDPFSCRLFCAFFLLFPDLDSNALAQDRSPHRGNMTDDAEPAHDFKEDELDDWQVDQPFTIKHQCASRRFPRNDPGQLQISPFTPETPFEVNSASSDGMMDVRYWVEPADEWESMAQYNSFNCEYCSRAQVELGAIAQC